MSLANSFRPVTLKRPNIKQHGKKLFWAWVAYQTVKGTLTTSLVWVPLIWALWDK